MATMKILQERGPRLPTMDLRQALLEQGWKRFDFERGGEVRSWPYLELATKGLVLVDVQGRSKFWSLSKLGREILETGIQGITYRDYSKALEASKLPVEFSPDEFEYAVHLLSHLLLRSPSEEDFTSKLNKLREKYGMPESIIDFISLKGFSKKDGKFTVSMPIYREER
jgi:hypothetical protein